MSKSYTRKNEKNLKTVTLGDVLVQTDKSSGLPKETIKGPDGEDMPKLYYLKVSVPEGVDEAGLGEPSMVLKNGDFLNFRVPDEKEIGDMPDWKAEKIQLICWKKKQDS